MPTAGDLVINFLGRHEQFSKTAATVRADLKKTGDAAKPATASIGSAFSPLLKLGAYAAGLAGVTVSVQAAVGAFASLVSAMDDIADTADRLNVSTDFFQQLSLAGASVGVDANAMAAGLDKMQNLVAEAARGNETAAKAFESLGLSARFLQSAGVENTFLAIAHALRKVEDPMERTRLEMDILGKSGPRMRSALDLATEGFGAFSTAIANKEAVKNIGAVADAWDVLVAKLKGGAANAIAPTIENFNTIMGVLRIKADENRGTVGGRWLGDMVGSLREEAAKAAEAARAAKEQNDALQLQNELTKSLEEEEGRLAALAEHRKKQQEEIAQSAEAARKAEEGIWGEYQKRGEAIRQSVRTPLEEMRETMAELDKLLSVGAIDRETHARAGLEAQAKRLAAEKGAAVDEAGAPKMQFAGAMERGSREAWSTILANLGGRAGDDEVKRLSREQVRAQRLIERNTAKLYEALREQRAGVEGEELFP